MNPDVSKQGEGTFVPPVSVFTGPIAELVGHRLLSPPTRPGLLASLTRFEVVRLLGGGGMGVVLLARDSDSGKDVAIKLIRPELVSDQKIVHRFVKEAGHLQKLKHPNVVPVLEVSDRPEGPYFVMPYFEKGSLANRIKTGQPLETEVALDIAREVAEGLTFAHRHGIIHRDLKPANILLGSDGKSCLADFGLARTIFNDSIIDVEREQLEGTAPYMSPGVANGNAEDTRCDIYAFGALLYEMLTGEPPYTGRTTHEIRKQILAGPPRQIQTRNPGADPKLTAVAEGAMARELRDRYADMGDIVADLERIKNGKPPLGPHGLTGRVKQMPGAFWIPAGVVLIAVGLWLMWPQSPEKQQAPKPDPATNLAPVVLTPPKPPPQPQPEPKPQPVVVTPTPVSPPQPSPPTVSPRNQWQVSILAGAPGVPGSADGKGANAQFQSPGGIAVDMVGNVYVADTGNNTIRKISRDGAVTTFAGLAGQAGTSDGNGTDARFLAPTGIAVDGVGNDIYVAEFANDLIRKITFQGLVSTLAGSAKNPGYADGVGDNAHFRNPWSVAVDARGNVIVADRSSYTIRRITRSGKVSTLAGSPGARGKTDGAAHLARFNDPISVAADLSGDIYVGDPGNHSVRLIDAHGSHVNSPMVFTVEGDKSMFSNVQCVAVGERGNVYILDGDAIRKLDSKGQVTTVPAPPLLDSKGYVVHPTSIAVDWWGNIYLAGDSAIWKVTPPPLFRPRPL